MVKRISIEDQDRYYSLGSLIKDDFGKFYSLDDLLNRSYIYIFGYYDKDKVVGFIHVSKSYEVIDIDNIVVDSDYQRKGIAKELLNYIFNYFEDATSYILEVREDNKAAINLYKSFDFKVINKRDKYYDDVDAFIMRKNVI